MLSKLGNIYCGHKMFLNKIRNIFLCPATNVARADKRGNICVGNNVSPFARALSTLKELFTHVHVRVQIVLCALVIEAFRSVNQCKI